MKHVCLQMSMVFVSQEHSQCWCMRCKHCALLCLHSGIRSGCGVGRFDALDTCTDMVPHRNGARQEDFIGGFAACGCVRSPMPLEGMGCVRTRRSHSSSSKCVAHVAARRHDDARAEARDQAALFWIRFIFFRQLSSRECIY